MNKKSTVQYGKQIHQAFFNFFAIVCKIWERPVCPCCDWPQPLTAAGA